MARERCTRPLVIGVGNPLRGDDGVGPRLIEILREQMGALEADLLTSSGEGAELIEAWEGRETVYVIDAVAADGRPGAIYCFHAHRADPPARFFNYSTHAFSLAEAIGVARKLDRLPRRLVVLGVEGVTFAHGAAMTPAVEQALANICDWLAAELTAPARGGVAPVETACMSSA